MGGGAASPGRVVTWEKRGSKAVSELGFLGQMLSVTHFGGRTINVPLEATPLELSCATYRF